MVDKPATVAPNSQPAPPCNWSVVSLHLAAAEPKFGAQSLSLPSITDVIAAAAAAWQAIVKGVQVAESDALAVLNSLDGNVGTIAKVLTTIAGIVALVPSNPELAATLAVLNVSVEILDGYITARAAGMTIGDAIVAGIKVVSSSLANIAQMVEQYGLALVTVFNNQNPTPTPVATS
jgi:hypothetical protein